MAIKLRKPIRIDPIDVAEKTASQWENCNGDVETHLTAIRAILDEEEPEYRH